MAGRVSPWGVTGRPKARWPGASKLPDWRASSLLSATAGRTVPVGARTMSEAQALGLLFVVLLFVAYGVWDLSHHR
jgi:hypothetical protein